MNTSLRAPLLLAVAAALASCTPGGGGKTVTLAGHTWDVIAGIWTVDGDSVVGSGGWIFTRDEIADGTFEADVELAQGMGDRTVGLGIRSAIAGGDITKASGYGANFTTNLKAFNVFKGTLGAWKPVNPAFTTFQPSPALPGGKTHVVLHFAGKTIVVEANGKTLLTVEDADHPRGRLQFWVESSGERVKFSNVKITAK